MWFLPTLFSWSDYERSKNAGWMLLQSAGTWGPSFPAAVLTGLLCAYVWARVKPWVSPNHANRKEFVLLEDLKNATSFLTSLHDALWTSKPQNSESISKASEDVLLKRTASRLKDGRRRTSEAITATLTIGAHAEAKEVSRLRRRMRSMGQKAHVLQVAEAAVLLQARLPITSSLLSQAFEVARRAVALDPHATLQLGSWGVILQSGDSHDRSITLLSS